MKKRWLCVLLGILLCGLLGSTALAERLWVVTNPNPEDRLHLRVSPSQNASSLGRYYNGTQVDVLKTYADGWAKVQIGPLSGYMMTRYLSDENQASAMPIVEGSWQGTVLYALPDITSTSQQIYSRCMSIMGFSDAWCHVYIPGLEVTGFVHASLDSLLNDNAVVKSWAWVDNPNSEDRLNLREKPSTSAASLGKYYNGVRVDILELAEDGWVKVRIGELAAGYMQAKYLSAYHISEAMPTVFATKSQQLRLEPRSSSQAMEASVDAGMGMTVLAVHGAWYHVRMENLDGYVQASDTDTQLKR